MIALHQMNPTHLPGFKLDLNKINLKNNLSDAVKNVSYVILTVPAPDIEDVLNNIKGNIDSKTIIILTSKGMVGEGISVSELTKNTFPNNKICGLYGITFAELVAGGDGFSSMSIASEDLCVAESVSKLFFNKRDPGHFRIYVSSDLRGTEFGGAMKNVYAIAMGLYDGYLKYVDQNPISKISLSNYSFLNLCIMEFIEFGLAYQAKIYTLLGPSGIGDIVACANESSRNYRYGLWNASLEFEDKANYEHALSLHEGYETVKSAQIIAKNCGVDTPILDTVYDILYNKNGIQNRIQSTIPPLIKKLAIIIESEEEEKLRKKICGSLKVPDTFPNGSINRSGITPFMTSIKP
jgi:glycerol-3-phosphate dehydrogenase (NAD(P)+)